MKRTIRRMLLVGAIIAVPAVDLSAQDVLMNSAETINPGNVKLAVFPTMVFGKYGGDDEWGAAGRFGVGLARGFDVEAKVAFYDGLKYFGGDAELWLVRNAPLDLSVAVGGHKTVRDFGPDSTGIDLAVIASGEVIPRLELYGGLKVAFESFGGSKDEVKLVHAVPGIEYRVSPDLDFLAEVGIAMNDDTRSYFSVGLAFYFR